MLAWISRMIRKNDTPSAASASQTIRPLFITR